MRSVTPNPTSETPPPAAAPADPFDLANLRLASNFAASAGVKKLLRTVPVRKPSKQEFVRVHSDPAFRENFAMIELKEDRESYLIAGPGLAIELAAEATDIDSVHRGQPAGCRVPLAGAAAERGRQGDGLALVGT